MKVPNKVLRQQTSEIFLHNDRICGKCDKHSQSGDEHAIGVNINTQILANVEGINLLRNFAHQSQDLRGICPLIRMS